MRVSRESVERALEWMGGLVAREPLLAAQRTESRALFHGLGWLALEREPESSAARSAARRHFEWFLFERQGELDAPALIESLAAPFQELAPAEERDAYDALLHSQPGVFSVTSVRAGEGLWLRDMLAHGEYPVEEPELAAEFQVGDVLVGRIFPLGDGVFCLSPAASTFRNPHLAAALTRDLEQARQGRRGSLRISQWELERMFHAPPDEPAEHPAAVELAHAQESDAAELDPRTARRAAAELLAQAGVTSEELESLYAQMWALPIDPRRVLLGAENVLSEWLDELAFDSDVDLEQARAALIEAWIEITRERESAAQGTPAKLEARAPSNPEPAAAQARAQPHASPEQRAKAALERFDAGRRGGVELGELFRQLERELGLEEGASESGDEFEGAAQAEDAQAEEPAPDFPGVVGALIEEFLWELGECESLEQAQRFAVLRELGRATQDLGLLEELDALVLVRYASLWLLREGHLTRAPDARAQLEALAAFAQWCESAQELPLWSALRAVQPMLEEALPRLAPLGDPDAPRAHCFQVRAVGEGGAVELLGGSGASRFARVEVALAEQLRSGDVIEGSFSGSEFRFTRAYPAPARAFLELG